MTRKIWSEVELSAYLDGELDASTRVALEAALKQNTDLQHRLQALQATVDWVRAVPMREVPKNYLLTPSIVAEKSPDKPQTRRGLLWMRMATSLTGLAFVITLGLNLLNSASPQTVTTQAPPAPNRMVMFQSEQTATEVASEQAADLDVPKAQGTLSPEDEMALVPASPTEAPGGMGETMEGVGGGAESAESESAPMKQLTIEQASPTLLEHEAAPSELDASEAGTPERDNIKPVTVITLTHIPVEQATARDELTLPEAFPPRWVSGVLGLVTLLLAGITYWLSRHA